ncbi:MAG: hypothetical protein WC523_03390 [Patescibacteria group bacterium]|jgi:hypothetical protein
MNKILRKAQKSPEKGVASISPDTMCPCFYGNIPVTAAIGQATKSKKSWCVPITKRNKNDNRSIPAKVCLDNLTFSDFRKKSQIKKSLQNCDRQEMEKERA